MVRHKVEGEPDNRSADTLSGTLSGTPGPAMLQFAGPGASVNRGSNQIGVRAYNERLVLALVRRHGQLARADIARLTGLSAQTVSVIIRALEKDGLITQGERVRGRVGQPSMPMRLAADGVFSFGLKIGRRSAEIILMDFLGTIRERRHITYRWPVPSEIRRFAIDSVAAFTEALDPGKRDRIAGLGIALPFELWNWVEEVGAPAEDLDAWLGADLVTDFAKAFSFPVFVQNDGTAACGAELTFGRGPEFTDFVYFFIGSFIGGGVVLNNTLYPGRTGNAGALGSMPMRMRGTWERGETLQLIDTASVRSRTHVAGTQSAFRRPVAFAGKLAQFRHAARRMGGACRTRAGACDGGGRLRHRLSRRSHRRLAARQCTPSHRGSDPRGAFMP